MTEVRIAFDERPCNGGPIRYVASLVRVLTAPEWSVHFVEKNPPASVTAPPATVATTVATTAVSAKSPKRLLRLVPRFAKNWLGFRRETNRLANRIRTTPVD